MWLIMKYNEYDNNEYKLMKIFYSDASIYIIYFLPIYFYLVS